MKLLFLLAVLFSAAPATVPRNADAILGTWANGSGKGHIHIYKSGDKYYGKIVWLREINGKDGKPRVDRHNPDPAKRTQPVLGMVMMRGFVYDKGEWNGGYIYNPSDGKEYKSYIKMKNHNEIVVRGYVGMSWFGKSDTWTRIS